LYEQSFSKPVGLPIVQQAVLKHKLLLENHTAQVKNDKRTHLVQYEIFTDEEQRHRHDTSENGRDEPRQYYQHKQTDG